MNESYRVKVEKYNRDIALKNKELIDRIKEVEELKHVYDNVLQKTAKKGKKFFDN